MKKIYAIVVAFPSLVFSQDLIKKVDGNIIETKIIEISNSEVKYKKFNNLSGPLFVIEKKDVSEIKYENGEVDKLRKTNLEIDAEYSELEKNNIESLFSKNRKAFLVKTDDANEDALKYFKNSLENWGYWTLVENESEADFVIVFSLKKKSMALRGAKAILKTKTGKIFMETKAFTGNATAFNGYNGSRAAANKVVENFLKKEFK
jgi:hypothetical protein